MIEKLNKLLNVNSKEWPRILVAWNMMFLTRVGFIVGWSVMVASFLTHLGIENLPFLFLSNAVLTILGVAFFRNLISKVPREILITGISISAAALLLAATFFIQTQVFAFFILLLIAESMLLGQLMILLSLFNEDLFTPLESQRTFPLIESAETLGGIAGGFMLTLMAHQLPAYKFVIIWALLLLLIPPIVLKFNSKTLPVPRLKLSEVEDEEEKIDTLSESYSTLKKIPFVKGLMLVILLHWGMMNIVEFQYTKAIQQQVYSVEEETLVMDQSSDLVHLASTGYEGEITEKLGLLHIVFNGVALFIQLVLGSRIITSLGIVSSLLVHQLVTLLNLLGLSLKFGFVTASLTRGSYECTGLIFKNAYESSYYAIPGHLRDGAKEIMQGLMKPIGAILGTLAIVLVTLKFTGSTQTLALNLILMGMSLLMCVILVRSNRRYTELSEQNLSKKNDLHTRLNAIEILAQNGHQHTTASLNKILNRENENEAIKLAILNTMGEQNDPESINPILESLSHKNLKIRLEAIHALSKFKHFEGKSFSFYRILTKLKERLTQEESSLIREEIVHFMHEMAPLELTEFLLQYIQSTHENKADFIRMMKYFNDPNLKYYLEPFLTDRSAEIRAAGIVALWHFKNMEAPLSHLLNQMLDSPKETVRLAGIAAAGEVRYKHSIKKLQTAIKDPSQKIHEAALLALAQMEDSSIVPHLIEKILNPEHPWFEDSATLLAHFPKRFKHQLEVVLHQRVSELIHQILLQERNLEKMGAETLKTLKNLYKKLSAHAEIQQIERIENQA